MSYTVMTEQVAAPEMEMQESNQNSNSFSNLANRINNSEHLTGTGYSPGVDAGSVVSNADAYCCAGCDTGIGHDDSESAFSSSVSFSNNSSLSVPGPSPSNLETATSEIAQDYVAEETPTTEEQKEVNEYNASGGGTSASQSQLYTGDSPFASLQERIGSFEPSQEYSSSNLSSESVVLDADNYCCAGCDTGTGHDGSEGTGSISNYEIKQETDSSGSLSVDAISTSDNLTTSTSDSYQSLDVVAAEMAFTSGVAIESNSFDQALQVGDQLYSENVSFEVLDQAASYATVSPAELNAAVSLKSTTPSVELEAAIALYEAENAIAPTTTASMSDNQALQSSSLEVSNVEGQDITIDRYVSTSTPDITITDAIATNTTVAMGVNVDSMLEQYVTNDVSVEAATPQATTQIAYEHSEIVDTAMTATTFAAIAEMYANNEVAEQQQTTEQTDEIATNLETALVLTNQLYSSTTQDMPSIEQSAEANYESKSVQMDNEAILEDAVLAMASMYVNQEQSTTTQNNPSEYATQQQEAKLLSIFEPAYESDIETIASEFSIEYNSHEMDPVSELISQYKNLESEEDEDYVANVKPSKKESEKEEIEEETAKPSKSKTKSKKKNTSKSNKKLGKKEAERKILRRKKNVKRHRKSNSKSGGKSRRSRSKTRKRNSAYSKRNT